MKKKSKYHSGLMCLHCGERLFSMSVHNYKNCKCKGDFGVMVDGGFDYFKYGFALGWKRNIDYKFIRMVIKK